MAADTAVSGVIVVLITVMGIIVGGIDRNRQRRGRYFADLGKRFDRHFRRQHAPRGTVQIGIAFHITIFFRTLHTVAHAIGIKVIDQIFVIFDQRLYRFGKLIGGGTVRRCLFAAAGKKFQFSRQPQSLHRIDRRSGRQTVIGNAFAAESGTVSAFNKDTCGAHFQQTGLFIAARQQKRNRFADLRQQRHRFFFITFGKQTVHSGNHAGSAAFHPKVKFIGKAAAFIIFITGHGSTFGKRNIFRQSSLRSHITVIIGAFAITLQFKKEFVIVQVIIQQFAGQQWRGTAHTKVILTPHASPFAALHQHFQIIIGKPLQTRPRISVKRIADKVQQTGKLIIARCGTKVLLFHIYPFNITNFIHLFKIAQQDFFANPAQV